MRYVKVQFVRLKKTTVPPIHLQFDDDVEEIIYKNSLLEVNSDGVVRIISNDNKYTYYYYSLNNPNIVGIMQGDDDED